MILLIPAYKIAQSKPGDQAADHLSNPVLREVPRQLILRRLLNVIDDENLPELQLQPELVMNRSV